MSESLRDLTINHLSKALKLMEYNKYQEASIELEQAEKASLEAETNDVFLYVQTIKGHLMQILGAYDEALKIHILTLNAIEAAIAINQDQGLHQIIFRMNLDAIFSLGNLFTDLGLFNKSQYCLELSLSIYLEMLKADPENIEFQSRVALTLNILGSLLSKMGRFEKAKQRHEKALEILDKLLKTNPENESFLSSVALTLNNLGLLLFNEGCFEEAKQRYELAIEISEKLLKTEPENVRYLSYVQNLLINISNLFSNKGHFEEAKQNYEKILEISEKLLKTDPDNLEYQSKVAITLLNLGSLLYKMGCFEETIQNTKKALEIFEKLLNADPENVEYRSQVASSLNNLATMLSNRGNFDEAKQRHERALEIDEKMIESDPENTAYQSSLATTQNNLGILLCRMGCFEEAKQMYEKALDIRKKLLKNNPENVMYLSDLATLLNNLGGLLSNMGRYEETKKRYEEVLEIYEKLLKIEPGNVIYQSYVGTSLNNLGLLLINMDRLEEAKSRYEKALEVREKLLINDPENVMYLSNLALTLHNNSLLLSKMGRFEEAKLRNEKAFEIFENLLKASPENVMYKMDLAMTLNSLGALLNEMERIEDAKQRIEKSLEIYESLLKIDPQNVTYQLCIGGTLSNLGMLLSNISRFDEANQKNKKALEISEKLLQLDPENIIYQMRVAIAHFNIGNSSYKQGNYIEARAFYVRAIKEYALNSEDLNFLFKLYLSIGRCCEKLGNYKGAFINCKKSIECVESIRTQYSKEEFKIDSMWDKSISYTEMVFLLCNRMNDPEKALEYLERFKSRTLLDSLRFLDLETSDNIPIELLDQEEKLILSIKALDRLKGKIEKSDKAAQLIRKIKKKEAELNEVYNRIREFSPEYTDLRKGQPLGIDEIKDLIGRQKNKTAFIEYFTSANKIFIFVMRSDNKQVKVKFFDLEEKSLRSDIQKYFESIHSKGKIEEIWEELSQKLIDPVFEYIRNCELVYIIPHGLLHYLPLHALFAEKKRLIEHFPIVYAPSLTAIKYSQSKPAREFRSCLSIGYTPNEKEKILFEGEAILVAKLFKGELKIGSEAASWILKNSRYDLIHISCHGGFDWKNSLNSGLRLADKDLKLNEIFDLNLRANLIVLSACETGLNEQKPGDELIGFTRAFLYAGAKSLIVSLWPVRAYSTFKFMESFYKKIKDNNMNKAEALQQAQLEFINDKQYSDPYLWAPFVLIGDWM